MENISAKLSPDVLNKYRLNNNTLIQYIRTEKERVLDLEIGDIKQPDFLPQIKLKGYNNEVNFSARLVHNEVATIETEGEKIKWRGEKIEAHFHDKPDICSEGGHAFDILIKEYNRAEDFVVLFTMMSKGLVFEKQPSYKDEFVVGQVTDCGVVATITDNYVYDADGRVMYHRPENVVGGYSIAHLKFGHIKGKNNYGCGEFAFAFRPYAYDEKGNFTWCELDITDGIMSVTVPQKFLAEAVGYVTIDPDFGYPTAGSSWANPSSCIAMIGAEHKYTASSGDKIIQFGWYGQSTRETGFDMAAYTVSALGIPQNRLALGIPIPVAVRDTEAWHLSSEIEQEMTAGVEYCVAIGNDGGYTESLKYNSGTGTNRSSDTTTGALPATWNQADTSSVRYSIYATYENVPSGLSTVNDLGYVFIDTVNEADKSYISDYNGLPSP